MIYLWYYYIFQFPFFWKPVYYKVDGLNFLSRSTKKYGLWVGIAKHVGHNMTFKEARDAKILKDELENNYRFNLKGMGSI